MPMRKAFLYSVLFHVAIAAVALIGIPGGGPLDIDPTEIIDVEIADLTQTTERRAPNPEPRPEPEPEPEPVAEPEPVPEPEPEPEEEQVAMLPPQPEPVPEPPAPESLPADVAQPEIPPIPVIPRAKPTPPKEDEFEMMLKDLQKDLETEPEEKEPEKTPKPEPDFLEDLARALDTPEDEPEPLQERAQKAPILGNKLTISEIDAVRRQIEPCWRVHVGARNPEELVVEIYVQMNRNGTVRRADVVDKSRMGSDRSYRAAAESALRALTSNKCSPLNLPLDKYDRWKEMTLRFDPSQMVGRR